MEVHAVNVLKGLRALVGEVVFEAALVALKDGPHVTFAAEPVVAAAVPVEEKKKRTRRITDEQRDVIRRNMTALQAFVKAEREAQPPDTPYSEVKRIAGQKWKAIADKDAWIAANLNGEPVEEKVVAVAEEPSAEKKGRGRPKRSSSAEGAAPVKVTRIGSA